LIGFVLASQAEVYTYQATQIALSRFNRGLEDGLAYIFSPMSIILIIIIVASVWLGARQSKGLQPEDRPLNTHGKTAPMIFAGLITAFLAIAFIDSFTISVFIDKVFPMTVAGFSLVGALILLLQMNRRSETDLLFNDGEQQGEDAGAPIGLWPTLAWFVSLLILTALFGFVIALTLFFLAFLMVRARTSPLQTALLTVAGVGAVLIIASALNRDFPSGLLQELIELPWPFGI
ncbi:MAG: tripartite tricarboxylate transporter permease, partial [Geminicoccaceae bacterium]